MRKGRSDNGVPFASAHASQDKSGSGVIELGVGPLHGVVALLAGRRESLMGHRSGGVIVVGLVATDARCNRDVVVVVGVTIGALTRRHHMRTGQRESRLGVIEGCGLPGRSVVARTASLRESTGNVVGIGGSLEILEVARHASVGGQVVVVVDVAVGAGARRDSMRARQREVDGVVIEDRPRPTCSGMAGLAGTRESAGNVIGIRCSLEIRQMARHAGGVA